MPKAAILKGTRDFLPHDVLKRQYLFSVLKDIFGAYGYLPIETPAMEKLETLSGKYGEEGDRLIYKILNSGDYFSDVPKDELGKVYLYKSSNLTPHLSSKALRYDLTVPLARFVAMHQHELSFPFKRFQIQPVWRADRPQKGRYTEFYQCDVDILGSESLYYEAELIRIYTDAFKKLGFSNFRIRLNHRQLLFELFQLSGAEKETGSLIIILDKLDKIGREKVSAQLQEKGLKAAKVEALLDLMLSANSGNINQNIAAVESFVSERDGNIKGLTELRQVIAFCETSPQYLEHLYFDPSLARGLDYYTGCIFEVIIPDSGMGSVGGGGRYDNLTEIFNVSGMAGVGVSFGAERILDLMNNMDLFPPDLLNLNQLMIASLDDSSFIYSLALSDDLRAKGVECELYPSAAKLKKQMKYANQKKFNYVLIIGEDEMISGILSLKDMLSGEQIKVNRDELIKILKPAI